MRKKYYIIKRPNIKERKVDISVTYGLPPQIEAKLTTEHPCIICKRGNYGIDSPIFCILADNSVDAEYKFFDYITIKKRIF